MISKTFSKLPWLAFAAFFLLLPFEMMAQDSKKIKINPAEGQTRASAWSKAYRYPAFLEGEVFFKDGSTAFSQLNYNMLSGEIEFIDQQKDILAVDDQFLIKFIGMGDELFFMMKKGRSC